VCSDSTLHRVFRQLDATTRSALLDAVAGVRAEVWSRTAATVTGEVVLDIDASLHEIHSENKAGTAAHDKGGFGFHPLYCFADATGECLGVKLRPGNAGANTIADHVEVLDQAIAGLPEEAAVGHRPGDDEGLVRRRLRVRTDSAGCTRFVHRCRERNVGFSVVARRNQDVHAAISRVRFDDDAWCPAVTQDGEEREGAAVAELTEFVDLSDWPEGTRLIVRREPRPRRLDRPARAVRDDRALLRPRRCWPPPSPTRSATPEMTVGSSGRAGSRPTPRAASRTAAAP
jgi:hypothetical protein